MNHISEIFGSMVFNDKVMHERLPKDIYKTLKKTILEGRQLDAAVASVVASVMKDWAIEKGATHFTHWFQPMTGITAEKHDSFISPTADGGVIMEFSGKELIKGEPDASSFPSGGLRTTFEARGYTAWDPTSYAFIKENTLCIPTVFCSYSGEALDKKTPLIRSMEALNRHSMRILNLFGNTTVKRVYPTVGVEQEYFLVDKALYNKRDDLRFCGRTLFGAMPPKDQETEAHYFGNIKPRVKAFMEELDTELWKLGILAKTEHNEAAPAQHEIAPIFSTVNIACDHNQLTMEIMKKVAERHNLVCLLHEKPFKGINGSGKHNNWSISTYDGQNLLNPGNSPYENAQFLLFLCAVIKAVDEYQDLLRLSVATAGNDCRLGGDEAPPAIISMFLGDELTEILEAIERDEDYSGASKNEFEIGIDALPHFPKDKTDRNRTSPLAFTGNKFEFRMPGSSMSVSGPNIVMNTIVADVLDSFATHLESAEDFKKSLNKLIKSTIKHHKRVIFNGNNYSVEWVKEAESRGLSNFNSAASALVHYTDNKNVELLVRHNIFTATEIESRCDILLDTYIKSVTIEALTMAGMARREIYPSVVSYLKNMCETIASQKAALGTLYCESLEQDVLKISSLADSLHKNIEKLSAATDKLKAINGLKESAEFCRDAVVPAMDALRADADELEKIVSASYWPLPVYSDLLYSIL